MRPPSSPLLLPTCDPHRAGKLQGKCRCLIFTEPQKVLAGKSSQCIQNCALDYCKLKVKVKGTRPPRLPGAVRRQLQQCLLVRHRCCATHDCCYGQLEKQECGTKFLSYEYTYKNGQILCGKKGSFHSTQSPLFILLSVPLCQALCWLQRSRCKETASLPQVARKRARGKENENTTWETPIGSR